VIHAIILGFGIGIGLFLWHFVVGCYAGWAEDRRFMKLLHPTPPRANSFAWLAELVREASVVVFAGVLIVASLYVFHIL
jgi:hypothetical protein